MSPVCSDEADFVFDESVKILDEESKDESLEPRLLKEVKLEEPKELDGFKLPNKLLKSTLPSTFKRPLPKLELPKELEELEPGLFEELPPFSGKKSSKIEEKLKSILLSLDTSISKIPFFKSSDIFISVVLLESAFISNFKSPSKISKFPIVFSVVSI